MAETREQTLYFHQAKRVAVARGRHAPTGQEQPGMGRRGAVPRLDRVWPNVCQARRNDAQGELPSPEGA